jgi:hypothetical protein
MWESYGKAMGKYRRIIGKLWGDIHRFMGQLWEHVRKYRNILGKLWESVGNPWEDVGKGKGLARLWKTMKPFQNGALLYIYGRIHF